jgi:hypothetical protein
MPIRQEVLISVRSQGQSDLAVTFPGEKSLGPSLFARWDKRKSHQFRQIPLSRNALSLGL